MGFVSVLVRHKESTEHTCLCKGLRLGVLIEDQLSSAIRIYFTVNMRISKNSI